MAKTKTKAPFVPYGKQLISAEFGEMPYGVHEETGIPYLWPKNVVDITCILCEEVTGRPLTVENQDGMEVTFPLCHSCRHEVMQFDELPDDLNELLLERMIARRIVDAQMEREKAKPKKAKAKSGPEKLDRDPA